MTSPQPKSEWSELLQPRNWSLPVKLIAVVIVPALFALVLGALRVLDQSEIVNQFDQAGRVATVQEKFSALSTELQDEREQAVQFVAVRDRTDPAPLQSAIAATDAARAATLQPPGYESDLAVGTVGALRGVENNYFRLTQLRRQVLTGANSAGELASQYGTVIEPLLVFDNALTRQLSNAEITGLSQTLGALDEAREQVSAEQSVVNAALAAGNLPEDQADALRAADARLLTATNVVRGVLNDEQQSQYAGFTRGQADIREQLKQSVLNRGRAKLPLEVLPQAWNDASTAVLKEIDSAQAGVRNDLRTISATQQEAASNRAGISSVFLLLAILLGAAIVYLVAKALISSLRTLRLSALDIADRQLPEAVQSMREGSVPDIDVQPVPVTSKEEIGQVARAFDAVHNQAIRLAAEQATLQSNVSNMFANLSRRSQALAERQLKLIEQLESNEQDPDQLSNLFQLDSLATRMRRNSENLLVLSGTDLSKRATQPVPVVDVLRAAVSEVEQYQRVVVQSPPDATIAGRAASDIVHLLAELVDNATNFSAPDTQVVMTSQRTPDGSVLIEIVDRGVGMGEGDLTDANSRLARPTALDVSVSRRMGLFVVGRLAARHGLGVRLGGGNTTAGTTASVTVPSYLVTAAGSGPDMSQGAFAPPAQRDGGLAARPGREFAPPGLGRGGSNGRPAPLSALVAGADAPIGSPGEPAPITPSPLGPPAGEYRPAPPAPAPNPASANGYHPSPPPPGAVPAGQPQQVPAQDRPAAQAEPPVGDLPARRPGQLLGQVPAAGPAATPRPEQQQPRPNGAEPAPAPTGDRQPWQTGVLPAPTGQARAEQSGPQRSQLRPVGPVQQSVPAADVAPVTEAFAVQPRQTQLPNPANGNAGQPQLSAAQSAAGQSAAATPTSAQPSPAQPSPARSTPAQPSPAQQASAQQVVAKPTPAQPGPPQSAPVQSNRSMFAPAQPATPQAPQPPASKPPTPTPQRSQPPVSQPRASRPQPLPQRQNQPPAAATSRPATTPQSAQSAGLFAPAVPAETQVSGPHGVADSSAHPIDPPETTPIFEEMASAWFRDDRQVPNSEEATGSTTSSDRRPAPRPDAAHVRKPVSPIRSAASPRPNPAQAPQAQPDPVSSPQRRPGWPSPSPDTATPVPTTPAAPIATPAAAIEPHSNGVAAAAGSSAPGRSTGSPGSAFDNAADEGWRAASAAVAAEPAADELTPAGLPKRRPRARLVPGAAASKSAPAVAPARTAESIRGRLASYQDGVRQGRETRLRREAAATSGRPADNRDEENR